MTTIIAIILCSALAGFLIRTPDDWNLVWSDSWKWTVRLGSLEYEERYQYLIEFSKIRKKYRLRCLGHKPTHHDQYSSALKKLAEFNNNLK